MPAAGEYVLHVRYAVGGSNARPLDLDLLGGGSAPQTQMAFASTDPDGDGAADGFDNWTVEIVTLTFVEGTNTVELAIPANANTGPDIDALALALPGVSVDFPVTDLDADAGNDLTAMPSAYTVGLTQSGSVAVMLSGVDDDITGLEVSTDGGANFAPAAFGPVAGGVAQLALDLSAITAPGLADIVLRVTDGAANTATAEVSLTFVEETVVAEIQAETFDIVTDLDTDIAEATNQGGFTGTGFLDLGNDNGDQVSFQVDAGVAGMHTLVFRYAVGSQAERPMNLAVDGGAPIRLPFSNTDNDWENWTDLPIDVELVDGINTITLENVDGNGPNIDRVTILKAAAPLDEPPTAINGTGTGLEDATSIVIDIADLIDDAEDLDEPTITVATVDPLHGEVTDITGTVLTFVPAANYNGGAVIDYTVEDSAGQTASAQVNVAVAGVNDAPTLTGPVPAATLDAGAARLICPH